MSIKQLVTNSDDRLSNTATFHTLGFIILSAVMLYSVYLDRDYVPELFSTMAFYCGGLVVTKGAVSAISQQTAGNQQSSINKDK